MDGHEGDSAGKGLLKRRLWLHAVALVVAGAGTAHAGDGDPDVGAGSCHVIKFCVSAGTQGHHGHQADQAGNAHGDSSDTDVKCRYVKVDPKPPADFPAWHGADPDKSDLYFYSCSDGGADNPDGFVAVPQGQNPQPQANPRELAQRAVDSMTLLGPDIASPRAAGRYTVGVPVWMWVNRSATTYGPNTASATAGGVSVTATAKVSKIVWQMGDGTSVTCHGPGTPYRASVGMAQSPTCGHLYSTTSAGAVHGRFRVRATSTWTIGWQGGGAAGQLTEVRQTNVQVAVGEVQVVR
ncbi:ATP/GTP-binding protein [Streptomyces sp. NPDC048489]|uniref:ATP/GTP-binding protein n=1 Tax=Streptomyces sp. NPDC048489 TaxID=3154504 RepID=UPI0034346462